ncbi:MAG: hydrogenase maturation nickel metallochaperone HypA [Deltaproteobacteria bacterium HGW-Deltaproteobacteria-7]|jgi:hydrogenase nickel incorporation protein HypA/HybF|nr:MAG: hydrogenase maturation nickel metallochaperone HypA [Deltaproteobacteria bacterium HGW-Deltaproteobacteria-7]PKN17790.1 MAG: hydrogenase maturation nickel metallochaperone HypA [Deltaproteobacteria bacterium HGW-Deltaproteobacteria-6]
MHELPVTESILQIVLKHARTNGVLRVVTVHLQIGRLSDLEDEWIQRYFDYLSKGSVAEGAKLIIERMPIMVQCSSCSTSYEADAAKLGDLTCPNCGGKDSRFLSGREYYIKDMEVQ